MVFLSGFSNGGRGIISQRSNHRLRNILVCFKAARRDAGAKGSTDVVGVTAIGFRHGGDGFSGDAQCGAAPACVTGSNSSGDRILQKNRAAVCGEYYKGGAGNIGDKTVCRIICMGIQPLSPVAFGAKPHGIPVYLHSLHGFSGIKANGIPQNFVVFSTFSRLSPRTAPDSWRQDVPGADAPRRVVNPWGDAIRSLW